MICMRQSGTFSSWQPCRSLITFVARHEGGKRFWERMRSVCPNSSMYNGPILLPDGQPCRTDLDVDQG